MIPADTIAQARDADLLTTAQRLGASLKKISTVEWAGACLRCGGGDRFSVNVKKQLWHCRGCGGGGGAIDLVRHVNDCDFRQAVDFLTGGRSIPDPHSPSRNWPPSTPYARPRPSTRAQLPAPNPGVQSLGAEEGAFAQLIARIVGELGPVRKTPGEKYLHEIRRIDTAAIADVLERTDAIGWHPSVLFRERGHALDGKRLGCIVCVMTNPVTAAPTGAISRTYLHEGGKVGKAKTLGAPAGIVRLSEDEDVLEGLHLAEGLESSLDAMAKGFRPMWSTGSTSLMASFPVLAGVACLTIFADHDANEAGLKAASEAASRWSAAGRETHIYQREMPGDCNDAFRETAQ